MKHILVSNDDGIEAAGVRALVKYLSHSAKVYVFAPAEQRSCTGQSISLRDTIQIEKTEMPGAAQAFKCSGKPADCVKFGLQWTEEHNIDIDFVFSGINLGANGGIDVHYSGTIGAAMEGALSGVRSIALSVYSHEASEFEYILEMISELIETSLEFPPSVVLSVNSPNLPKWKIKGVKVVECGPRSFIDRLIESDGKKNEYIYKGKPVDFSNAGTDMDLGAIRNGYATITPLLTNFTDYAAMLKMRRMAKRKVVCLLMNFQEKIIPHMYDSSHVIEKASRAAACAKELGITTLISQLYTRGSGGTARPIREAVGSFEHVESICYDLFEEPGFNKAAESLSGSTVVIAGFEAHISVQQTALGFKRRGYDVIVLGDCCSSKNREDMECAMQLLANEGCEVTTYEAFVYDMLGSSAHERYDAVSNIINAEYEDEEEPADSEEEAVIEEALPENTPSEVQVINKDESSNSEHIVIPANDSSDDIGEPAEKIKPAPFGDEDPLLTEYRMKH